MGHGPIVVCERRPQWVPELQRRFAGDGTEVQGCSTTADVRAAVKRGTRVVVLVLDEAEGPCLELLGRFAAETAVPRVIVVGSRYSADLEWPMRELGAAAFVTGRTTSDDMVQLCRRMMTDHVSLNSQEFSPISVPPL